MRKFSSVVVLIGSFAIPPSPGELLLSDDIGDGFGVDPR